MSKHTELALKELGKFVGAKVVGVNASPSDDEFFSEDFVGLVLEMPNGEQVVVTFLSDEEGNAPGAWDVTKVPTKYKIK